MTADNYFCIKELKTMILFFADFTVFIIDKSWDKSHNWCTDLKQTLYLVYIKFYRQNKCSGFYETPFRRRITENTTEIQSGDRYVSGYQERR